MIGPVEYTPSASFVPSLTAPVQPAAASTGLLGGIASAFSSALSFATAPQTQQAFTNIYGAVSQWRELDIRKDEMTTAQKIAAMANSWLNPQVPSVSTPGIVTVGQPATPGPVDTATAGGLSPIVLIGGAVVLFMLFSKR
ncbi:MAG: hypothetical protein PHR30_18675 [Gallionellaceae bacterium]|nr:hypothetical protein [Gallionellaceae bacterium]